MLRPDQNVERVYLHRAPVDMRKQMDGLSILAKDVIRHVTGNHAAFFPGVDSRVSIAPL